MVFSSLWIIVLGTSESISLDNAPPEWGSTDKNNLPPHHQEQRIHWFSEPMWSIHQLSKIWYEFWDHGYGTKLTRSTRSSPGRRWSTAKMSSLKGSPNQSLGISAIHHCKVDPYMYRSTWDLPSGRYLCLHNVRHFRTTSASRNVISPSVLAHAIYSALCRSLVGYQDVFLVKTPYGHFISSVNG